MFHFFKEIIRYILGACYKLVEKKMEFWNNAANPLPEPVYELFNVEQFWNNGTMLSN